MDVCDAIEQADLEDIAIPEQWEHVMAVVTDIDRASDQLQADFRFPVSPTGEVMMLQYMHPDVMPTLVYHLVRCGWRRDESKALIKARPVVGALYEDLVAWVEVSQPDEPIVVEQPEIPEGLSDSWTVRPQVNVIEEKR